MCVFAKPQTLVHAGVQCLHLDQLTPWESTAGSTVGNPLRRWHTSKPQAVVVMAANSRACRVRTKNLSAVPCVDPTALCDGLHAHVPDKGTQPQAGDVWQECPPGVFKGSQTLCFLTIQSQVLLNTYELCVGVSEVSCNTPRCGRWAAGWRPLQRWLHALTQ